MKSATGTITTNGGQEVYFETSSSGEVKFYRSDGKPLGDEDAKAIMDFVVEAVEKANEIRHDGRSVSLTITTNPKGVSK